MCSRILLGVVLLASVRLWSQVDTADANDTGAETSASLTNSTQMVTPPPVSGAPYDTSPLSEARSNYLRGTVLFNSAYSDNATVSATGQAVSDVSYSIWPSIALDETTPRSHTVLSYSPGFTFYQRLSALDATDQSFALSFQYRLSPHITLTVRDSLHKTSSTFNQPNFLSDVPITGSIQAPVVSVVAPVSDLLTNNAEASLTYQFSRDEMVGINGTFTNLHYPNSSQVPGLYDSSSAGGSAFYTHRVATRHYLGASYQYQRLVSYPQGPENVTLTQSIMGFYTLMLRRTLSISVSGGPQHSNLQQAPLPPAGSWSPAETVSLSWRAQRTSLAASYSHLVSGGGGLVGAFHSNVANGSLTRQLTKNLQVQASAGYSIYKTVNPLFALVNSNGGHSLFGTVTMQRKWGQNLSTAIGYTRLHQSYSGVEVIATAPDTNREYVSVSYQFSRPLGR